MHIDLTESLRPGVGREQVFSVSFDPLDGSSIIDANFAVGSVQRPAPIAGPLPLRDAE